MTPQQAQAQALIQEIDSVLYKASPRLPWVMSNEDAQQRQLLQQLRAYLVTSLQVPSPSPAMPADRSRSLVTGEVSGRQADPSAHLGQLDAMQQTLHAMIQEMTHLRSTVLQPLQADVVGLQQQREFLRQEVQQLESQRQAAIAAATPTTSEAISQQVLQEVLQLLMQRLQESLSQQISQHINQAFQRLQTALQPTHDLSSASTPSGLLPGMTAEQVKNLEVLQSRTDQILTTIDTTLRVVFESIQRNLESYQDSLTRGLERMHGLGQQSEAQFAALLNHLAQRLGQEASAYLNASLQTQGVIAPEAPAVRGVVRPAAAPSPAALPTEAIVEEALPFPGSELGGGSSEVFLFPTQPKAARATPSAQRSETLQLEDLDLSDFNLDALDTSLIDAEGTDLDAFPLVAEEQGGEDLAAENLGTELVAAKIAHEARSGETTTEAEAMDFLNQLAETFDAPPLVREDEALPSVIPPTSWTGGSTAAELRELYQSLFGSDEFADTAPVTSPSRLVSSEVVSPTHSPSAATTATSPTDTPTLESLFGGLDATIHPDSFDLDTLATELSQAEALLSELSELSEIGDTSPTSPEADADLIAGWADASLEALREQSSSLEDFFFPESHPQTRPLTAITEPEAEQAGWLDDAALERHAAEVTIEPASLTASSDLPNLDTDPFNLGALAADFSDLSDLSGRSGAGEAETSGPDLADLLADVSTAVTATGLSSIETGVGSPSPEDSFDAAAPDEDLLAAEDLQATASPDLLQIDDQTLQQLSEDLFSLESGEFTVAETPQLPDERAARTGSPAAPMATPIPSSQTNLSASFEDTESLEAMPDLVPRTPELSVEAFAADLFGGLDTEGSPATTGEASASHISRSTTEASTRELETEFSLAVLEDLFTDSPPRASTPESASPPEPDRSDEGVLEDLFADFGDPDVASQTAENNLASFQAEFPAWDTDDAAKKKF
ncbi:hypothetical protein [Trichothermofontia sp.]